MIVFEERKGLNASERKIINKILINKQHQKASEKEHKKVKIRGT